MKDYLELSFRTPQELSQARASKANPVVLKDHFEKLKKLFDNYSLTPDRIWNMDESGFNISARLQKVIAKKNA